VILPGCDKLVQAQLEPEQTRTDACCSLILVLTLFTGLCTRPSVLVLNVTCCICYRTRSAGTIPTMATPMRSTATWLPGHLGLGSSLRRTGAAPAAEEVALGADGVKSVHVGRAPVTFTVLSGEVLLTAAGDLEDHVLHAGQVFRSVRRGHHVLLALGPARVRVSR
jgi:hypothetical protein